MKMIKNLGINTDFSKKELKAAFGQELEFDKDLSQYSSYKTGGKTRLFILAKTVDKLTHIVQTANDLEISVFIIGGGTNLLISDNGFNGLIIKVNINGIKLKDETIIECYAGEKLMNLVDFATENSLTGIEFASGIWGTVGGAIFGNAGAYGGEMKDIIIELTLIDRKGVIKTVTPDYCGFGYRDSNLKRTDDMIISALFQLKKGNKQEIKNRVEEILKIRKEKHPLEGNSAGCFFKNIPDPNEKFGKLSAGKLLEEIGAKGLSVGGAKVYEKHANMIINTGNATSKDIRQLADILKEKVYQKFGIKLEEEVIQVGKF